MFVILLLDNTFAETFANVAGVFADLNGEQLTYRTLLLTARFIDIFGCPSLPFCPCLLNEDCSMTMWCAGIACHAHYTPAGFHGRLWLQQIITAEFLNNRVITYVSLLS